MTLVTMSLLLEVPAFAQINFLLRFDGQNDRVDLGTQLPGGLRTIEFWFEAGGDFTPSTSSPGRTFIARNDGFQVHEFGVHMRGTDWPTGRGNLYFFMRDDGELHEIASDQDTWVQGQWYHVCGTIDQDQGMRLFIDAELQADTDPTGTMPIPFSPEPVTVGRWGDYDSRYYDSRMDELRVWNRALSAPEIEARMCSALDWTQETGLVGYWRMNEGAGVVLSDDSGFGADGLINEAGYEQEEYCQTIHTAVPATAVHSSVQAGPLPWVDQLFLTFSEVPVNGLMEVYDMSGRRVLAIGGLAARSITLERGDLAAGMHLLRISDERSGTRALLVPVTPR